MKIQNRQLDRNETSKLLEGIRRLENIAYPKLNWAAILVLALLTILFAIHIYYYYKSNWSLISKFLVCVCPIIIWVLIENKYKGRKTSLKGLNELKEIEVKKIINVIEIDATRAIEFTEEDDEGKLYLIEKTDGQCFYLGDEQYLISDDKPFPCSKFDIYVDRNFKYAIEEKVNCKGEKIEPFKISGKDKWAYFKERGFPDDFEIEENNLDDVIKEIKTIS